MSNCFLNDGFEVGILRQAQDKFFIFRCGLRRKFSHRLPKLTGDFCCGGFFILKQVWIPMVRYCIMFIVLSTNRKDYEPFYAVGSEIWS